MERVLKLPVNEYWYNLIKTGKLTHDYREIKPYWTKRLEGQEYDVVEFYHRFKKEIPPMRFKFEWVKMGRLVNYNMDVYLIKFGERIDNITETLWGRSMDRALGNEVRKEDDINGLGKEDFYNYLMDRYKFVDESHSQILFSNSGISFPLFRNGYTWFRMYIKFVGDNMERLLINAYKEGCKDFYDAVASKFELTHTNNGIIVTKNNEVSNSICVEFIDTVLANTKTPIYDISILNK